MNTNDSGNLVAIETDPHLWIDLLVDNELTFSQREKLCKYFELNPKWWRVCGQRFMDEQRLKGALRSGKSESSRDRNRVAATQEGEFGPVHSVVKSSALENSTAAFGSQVSGKKAPSAQSKLVSQRPATAGSGAFWLALVASLAFLVGGGTSYWLSRNATRIDQQVTVLESNLDRKLTRIANTYEEAYELAAEQERIQIVQQSDRDVNALRSIARNQMLIEVENDEKRAVYYSQGTIPAFLLQSLVLAGHQVKVNQEWVEVPHRQGGTTRYPIHQLEIQKFALLSSMNLERKQNHVD